jgi:hypothetical protein
MYRRIFGESRRNFRAIEPCRSEWPLVLSRLHELVFLLCFDTIAGDIAGLLDGKEFKQTAYAYDPSSRKAALVQFLRKASGEDEKDGGQEQLAQRCRRVLFADQVCRRRLPVFRSMPPSSESPSRRLPQGTSLRPDASVATTPYRFLQCANIPSALLSVVVTWLARWNEAWDRIPSCNALKFEFAISHVIFQITGAFLKMFLRRLLYF